MIKWIGQHIWDFISRFRNDVYLEDLSDPGSDTDKFLVVDANDKVGYRTGAEVLNDIGGSGGGATTFTLTADSGSNQTIADGNTLDIAGGNAITTVVGATDTVTINHDDTSSQASVDNSGRTYIQDVTLDTYGHVTGLVSATETVTDTTYSEATSSDAGLMSTAHHDKLDGIEDGAEVNVQSDWNAGSGDAFIQNKPTIPSGNQIIDWTQSGAGTIHTDNYIENVVQTTVSGSSGSCTGNAATATEATNITVSANNSSDETVYPIFVDGATGTQGAESDTGLTYNPSSGMLTTTGVTATFTGNITGNVTGNTSGSSGSCTGNAATATALATARGLQVDLTETDSSNFDGSGDVTDIGVTGALAVGNGGTGATSLNNLITLTTHTTGNYVKKVTTGTGLGGAVDSEGGTAAMTLALGDLADMTQSWVTAEDEFIVLDNGTQKRKLSSEIFGSNAFTSTTIGTTTNALTFDDTTVQLNTGTTFDGSAARTVSAKTAAVSNGASTLATGGQIYDFFDSAVSPYLHAALTVNSNIADVLGLSTQELGATDPGDADALAGWDHSANKFTYLSAADAKTALSLNNVENTALSTWAGSANLTTAGALNSGSITSGFGNIDTGSSTIDTTGAVSTGTLTADQIKHEISGSLTAGDIGHGAEVLYGVGTTSVTAGRIYTLHGGTWEEINAGNEDDSSGLMAVASVAAGNGNSSNGMIIKGCVTLENAYVSTTNEELGAIVYSSTVNGKATTVMPSSSNEFVRILGYSLNVSDKKMFFNPDTTYIQRS